MEKLNITEAKEKTLELINKTGFSLVRPDFTKYDTIYPFTTENLSYLEQINLKAKDVLTVNGSFDHCLNLVLFGVHSVTNFDVNELTIYFAYFKYAAIKIFSYEEYIDFFFGDDKFSFQKYQLLRNNLSLEMQDYWDYVYSLFQNDAKRLCTSHLFHNANNFTHIKLSNPYLKNEQNYNRVKNSIDNIFIDFETRNVLDIGNNVDKNKLYDVMLFSNIETYLVEDVYSTMSEDDYLHFICEQASQELKDDGIIQVAYQYQYKYKQKLEVNRSLLQKIFKSRYVLNRIEYLESKCKVISFTGLPLVETYVMCDEIKDGVYLYQKPRERNR